jgi:hypothetical protein
MLAPAGILGTVFLVIVLIVIAGMVIIGAAGALLSRSRGGTLTSGFLWAVLVPPWPLGLAFVWWRTRASASALSEWPNPSEDRLEPPLPVPTPTGPPRGDGRPAGSGGRRF